MTSDGEGEAIDEQPIRWGREAPLEERLCALADFVPIFERPGFEFQLKSSDHHTVYSAEAHRFIEVAYELRWVRPFDWPSWTQTAEAAPFKQAEGIASASPEQLSRVLTVLVRQDRFVEGGLGSAFDSGHLLAICRRAAELLRGLAG